MNEINFWGKKFVNSKGYKFVLGESQYAHRFGGHNWNLPICKNCNTEYHQLITLDLSDPSLEFLGMDKNNELPLISCLNCSSWWEYQSYKIDFENNKIELVDVVDEFNEIQDEEDKFSLVFPERKMSLVPLEEKEKPITEELYYEILDSLGEEYICRVGGIPVFMTEEISDSCPSCGDKLTFIAQIAPAPYDDYNVLDGVEFFFGDGVLYFYYCKKCQTMHVITQA